MFLSNSGVAQGETKFVLFSEVEQHLPEVYLSIEALLESFPVATVGPLTSGFAPFGIVLQVEQVQKNLSEEKTICEAIYGKHLYYDKIGNGQEIFKIVADSSQGTCAVKLRPVSSSDVDKRYLEISRNLSSSTELLEHNDISRQKISEIKVYENAFGEVVEVRFFKETQVPQSMLDMGFALNPDETGNQRVLYFKYNFPLERGIKYD